MKPVMRIAHQRREQITDKRARPSLDFNGDGHAGVKLTRLSSICICVRSSEIRAA
jgi:hypothetical protein